MEEQQDSAQIEVGDTAPPSLLDRLGQYTDEARRDELARQLRRERAAQEIAQARWIIATEHHVLEDGRSRLNFDERPFLVDIYKDAALDCVIYGSAQFGKASAVDANVRTPDGWKRMGDIAAGDFVSTPDGGQARVLGVYPQGKVPIYRVTFIDGRSTEVCGNHLWKVSSHQSGAWKRGPVIIKTVDLKKYVDGSSGHYRFRIPLTEPVASREKNLPIDPYLLGLMLGDGTITRSKGLGYSSADPELVDSVNSLLPAGWSLNQYPYSKKCDYRIGRTGGIRGRQNPFADSLRSIGLLGTRSHTKFVPDIYKEGSADQRLAVLQGLMDTDGYARICASFTSTSQQLAEDVQYLVRSLGGIAWISTKTPTYTYKGEKKVGKLAHTVHIRHKRPDELFRLERKKARLLHKYRQADSLQLAIESIEPAGEKEAQCIYIDHPDHLYITDDFIVTHNTEFEICDVAASAMYGLKCMVVLSTQPKRDRFVSMRIEPCFENVGVYKAAAAQARERGLEAESVKQKGFGPGSISFLAASVAREFTSTPADAGWIDEYQECNQDNIAKIDDRFSGSWFRGIKRIGHPDFVGTEKNNNLDWLYQNSDQRVWEVPCVTCSRFQVLKWDEHVVHVKYNKHGAIIETRVRDQEWRPGSKWDIRPICKFCHRPMNRLSRQGHWNIRNPGHSRHGFKLSNLYNPYKNLKDLFDRYQQAKHKPAAMAELVNKQFGETYGASGDRIEEHLLQACADGEQIPPYKFYAVSGLAWRKPVSAADLAAEKEAAQW